MDGRNATRIYAKQAGGGWYEADGKKQKSEEAAIIVLLQSGGFYTCSKQDKSPGLLIPRLSPLYTVLRNTYLLQIPDKNPVRMIVMS